MYSGRGANCNGSKLDDTKTRTLVVQAKGPMEGALLSHKLLQSCGTGRLVS